MLSNRTGELICGLMLARVLVSFNPFSDKLLHLSDPKSSETCWSSPNKFHVSSGMILCRLEESVVLMGKQSRHALRPASEEKALMQRGCFMHERPLASVQGGSRLEQSESPRCHQVTIISTRAES
jgi:hypothetical protein